MQEILDQLKIKAEVVEVQNNGTISKYFLRLSPGTKVDKLEKYATEIALGLKAFSRPIVKAITERGLVSVELLTQQQKEVAFSSIMPALEYAKEEIPVILGKTHDGDDLIIDLAKMPHLLLAGATGSGKSVMLHSLICSTILSNKNIKLALIDPKTVEFSYYKNIKQLLYPVVSDPENALDVLDDLIDEMEYRFSVMAKKSVNNIIDYNAKTAKNLPYIVLVIDEFSDLMQSFRKDFQSKVTVLAQKSRACGIHIILATQRPSVDVVTGLIKANFPSRVSCRVSSAVDSRVVLDRNGAERLLGSGDALLNCGTFEMLRFKGAYLGVDEITKVCDSNKRSTLLDFWKKLW